MIHITFNYATHIDPNLPPHPSNSISLKKVHELISHRSLRASTIIVFFRPMESEKLLIGNLLQFFLGPG